MNATNAKGSTDLAGYEIVTAVCGGIAAYKVCHVVSRLVQRGAGVTVVMTRSARRFVGPTTFQALSARPVITGLFNPVHSHDPQHINLMRRADAVLVAPATANMIAKLACGICDEVVSTMVVAADAPVVVAPAMNDAMWTNPAVQANVAKLTEYGHRIVGPVEGWMACRTVGMGRMADPDDIIGFVADLMSQEPPRNAPTDRAAKTGE